MAYFNMIRTVIGPGLLGMPVAMSSSGLLLGSFVTLLVGIIIVHTHRLLLLNLREISRQLRIPCISYRYGFRLALLHGPPIWHSIGHRGPLLIATFMILLQLGICTVNVIMTVDSLRDIADCESLKPALMFLFPCYLILAYFMKNLRRISYVSLFATVVNTLGLLLLLFFIFNERQVGFFYQRVVSVGGLMFTIGMCMFNFSTVGVIIILDRDLRNPKIMTDKFGVIHIGLGISTILSVIFGDLGYWAFGSMEENCLRSLPYDDFLTMLTIGAYFLSMALTYPLQSYPAIAEVIEVVKHGTAKIPTPETLKLIDTISRPIFVTITFFIAYHVPFQGPFVAFVGNMCASLMSVIFPIMMDISLMYNVPGAYGKYNIYLIKDIIILILGVITWGFGIYYSAYLIYIRLKSLKSPSMNFYL